MSQSQLDRPDVKDAVGKWVLEGETNASIVRKLADTFDLTTSEKSIRRFRKRYELNPAAFEADFTEIKGNKAEGSVTTQVLTDPDEMLRQRGLDPTEWVITALRANEYEGPASAEWAEKTGENKQTYYQTRFNVERKGGGQIVAARSDGWRAPRIVRQDKAGYPETVVIVGDQQAPFHDQGLHAAFLAFLEDVQPHRGISLGDTVDFPNISRHQLDPENTATVNECIQAGYDLLRGYVDASPSTAWTKIPGNHDERIRNLLLGKPKVTPLYGVKQADSQDTEGADVLSVQHLLRLDELGIEYVDPKGPYDLAQINLSPYLAVRHGWIARQDSGASAVQTLKHLGYNVIVGHTHRQSLVHKTTHDIDGKPTVLTAVEAGCMCRISNVADDNGRRFPDYTVAPDWQQGFATATIWPDGKFRIDLATYVDGTLIYRDKRYSA